jgi:hypothetical protein
MQGMGSAKQTSTIVKAAARRQLRGEAPGRDSIFLRRSSAALLLTRTWWAGDSDKKPVKEVAAEIRKKMQSQGESERPSVVACLCQGPPFGLPTWARPARMRARERCTPGERGVARGSLQVV